MAEKRRTQRRSGGVGAVMGWWMGAGVLGCAAAYVATFLLTGKLFVPHREGDALVSLDEAATLLDRVVEDAQGGTDE